MKQSPQPGGGRKLARAALTLAALLIAARGAMAQQPTEYKIGLIHYGMGVGGETMLHAAELAVERVNAKGGIPFKIVAEDNQNCKPAPAVNAARKLIDVDNVQVIMSSCSGPTLAVAPVAAQKKVLVFNIGAGSPNLLKANDYLINFVVLNDWKFPPVLAYLRDTQKVKRIAIIAGSDELGQANKKIVETFAPRLGLEVVASETVSPETTDLTPIVQRVARAKPDALLPEVGTIGKWGQLEKTVREQGYDWKIFITGPTTALYDVAGPAADGIMWSADYLDPKNPVTKDFIDTFTKRYGVAPDFAAGVVYDTVMAIAQATQVARQGGGNYYTGERLRAAMEKQRTFSDGLVGGTVTLLDDNTVSRTLAVMRYDYASKSAVMLKTYTKQDLQKQLK